MLEDELIHRVFLLPEDNDRDIEQLLKWNKSNKPPMSIVKGQLEEYLCERNALLEQSIAIADRVISNLIRNKANVSILRAYINLLTEKREVKPEQADRMLALWRKVPLDCLEMFLDAFHVRERLTAELQLMGELSVDGFVTELIKARRFEDCLKLVKIFGKQHKHVNEMLGGMCTNEWVSQAANIILELDLDIEQYPQIKERLSKKCMRHFLKRQGWHYVEQLYYQKPSMLAAAVEDLLYDKKVSEALTIYSRHLKHRDELIRKDDIRKTLQTHLEKEFTILENPLEIDRFGPADPAKQLSLHELGIEEESVIFLDDNHPELERHLQELFSERMLGFDTESLVGVTKLEQETEGLALVQVANSKRVYLFDCFRMKSPVIAKYFSEYFQGEGIKLGHAIVQDLRAICIQLSIPKVVERVIDTWHIYKGLHPQQKHSNLSHICRKLLGKEICKAQTLSNWRRRPLRRNQMHYAAMDAYVVLRIYQRMLSQYGEQYLSHFIEEDELRQQIEFC